MHVKCPNCGTDNTEDSEFCKKSGTQLIEFHEKAIPTQTLEAPKEELTTGSTFAERYQIIEELGKGGMGRVYKAHDTKIKEKIALKLIKPEIAKDKKTIERFSNELRLARKIRHKNVCGMFDLGEEKGTHYITMEFVPGEDLRSLIRRIGQLPIGKSISISKQICEGLAEAHRLGVVHRDLKSNNIMIDKEGNVRIMDFGIARSLEAKRITGAGVMIGTPEYMSPEQVEGKEVDQRSDIYSLGIILYEMVTGRVPFEGDTPFTIGMKHKGEMPQNPMELNAQIPDDLNWLILRCLEKEKDKRYQNAREVRSGLENIEKGIPATDKEVPKRKSITSKEITLTFGLKKLFVPTVIFLTIVAIGVIVWRLLPQKESLPLLSGKPSLAVLPFEDLSPQKDQEYLCDGMTDEIIAKLSALEGWKVISRTSVMRFKKKDIDIREIGQELDVTTILEGTVRKEKDDIRVTAQLVNVRDRFQIWSNTYNQKLEKIFDIQSNIAEKIAEALKTKLSPEEGTRLKKRPTESFQAHSLYLQGRWFWSKRTEEDLRKAIEYFEKALKEDPNYAKAYAGLADTYAVIPFFSSIQPKQAYGKAKEAVLKSLEIDNTIAEAYTSLAAIKEQIEFDWEGAYKDHKRALELNPGYATAHHWYAIHLICRGLHDEALAEITKAHELDPLSFIINNYIGEILYWSQRYDQASDQFEKTLELFPNNAEAHVRLGMVYLELGKLEDAIVEVQKAINITEGFLDHTARLGYAYAVYGRRDDAIRIINELKNQMKQKYISPYLIAAIYSALNERDFAFQWLDKAYETRYVNVIFLKVDPIFDNFRSDQRFNTMLKKMNLD
jgi:serine/threonine protein kinase/Tfp pilus assembly protein PilF